MRALKIEADGSIKLPEEMLRLFPTSTELAVWTEGDMIVLKRLQPLKPLQIPERVREKEPPIKDIASEVHRVRRETDEDRKVVQRQNAMLQKGFPMGKLLYKKREELHGCRKQSH